MSVGVWWWVAGLSLFFVAVIYGGIALWCRVAFNPSEVIPIRTDDGHGLHLYRHRPPDDVAARGVVLCLHGLGASHFNFDFPGGADFAGFLARSGYDVFVATLRGDWDARRPNGTAWDWTFDDHVRLDMPALMDAVLKTTGAAKVHLVGHSMGGLLAYAYAGVHGDRAIQSICAIGSPVGFAEKAKVLFEQDWLEHIVRRLPGFYVRLVSRLTLPILAVGLGGRFTEMQYNPKNVVHSYVMRASWHALSDISRGILLQFTDWIRHDAFRSVDGVVDYRETLRVLSAPLLVIAGPVDRLCRPGNALRAVELAGSRIKKGVLVGVETGCGLDYGHIDLVFGMRAEAEVYARVATFIREIDEQADDIGQLAG